MIRSSHSDLIELFAGLGIVAGDRVMVHSFVPSLGLVEGGIATVYRALADSLGLRGTLIVPTFTYSLRRAEVFDPRSSTSQVGAFSEYVRRLPEAVRSTCPMFSIAAIGPDATLLTARRSTNCFGRDSIYETLFAMDVKFVGLGVDWDEGYTFFLHLERLASIPMRQDQAFFGTSRDWHGGEFADTAVHYVRREDLAWRRDRGPLCRELVAQGFVREVVVRGAAHRLFPAADVGPAVAARLRADPWCMAVRL